MHIHEYMCMHTYVCPCMHIDKDYFFQWIERNTLAKAVLYVTNLSLSCYKQSANDIFSKFTKTKLQR